MNHEYDKTTLNTYSFWEHLESLRWALFRTLGVVSLSFGVLFSIKDFLFDKVILAATNSDFVFYQVLRQLSVYWQLPEIYPGEFKLQLININLAGQLMAHLGVSVSFALLLSIPYILFEIWRFVSPALYKTENKPVALLFVFSSALFYMGAMVSYFVIFPLTVRFLGTYEVSALIPNQITLQSYLSAFYILVFSMGIMFEMPVLAYFLSKMGVLKRTTLRSGRNIAIVLILIISALITPITDPFTMLVMALPLYILFELSILVCKK